MEASEPGIVVLTSREETVAAMEVLRMAYAAGADIAARNLYADRRFKVRSDPDNDSFEPIRLNTDQVQILIGAIGWLINSSHELQAWADTTGAVRARYTKNIKQISPTDQQFAEAKAKTADEVKTARRAATRFALSLRTTDSFMPAGIAKQH